MKRRRVLLLVLLTFITSIFLIGCEKDKKDLSTSEFIIGINQFTEHPALDFVREGFEDGIKELDFNASIDFKNAQGNLPNTISISQKFLDADVDLIFAIATPSAQSTKQVVNNLPVLFSAVTDPVEAGLVESFESPATNVTGTSDESPIERQLQLFKDLDPSIKKIGIIFNTGEPNSKVQVDNAKEIASKLGLEIETMGITKISDMPQAVDSIIAKVQGIYTITDNMVASAINVISEKANKRGIITIGAEESHVAGGILMTDGISYYQLGKQTAEMAKEILVNKKDIETFSCQTAKTTEKVYNEETLNTLNLSIENKAFENANKLK